MQMRALVHIITLVHLSAPAAPRRQSAILRIIPKGVSIPLSRRILAAERSMRQSIKRKGCCLTNYTFVEKDARRVHCLSHDFRRRLARSGFGANRRTAADR